MSEFFPLDSGSENSYIIKNQFPGENIYFQEDGNPNMNTKNNSLSKASVEQISIIPQILIGNKRPKPLNNEPIHENDVGEITAKSIYEFFHQEQTIDLIKRLKNAGDNTEKQKNDIELDNRFEGKTFVLTGSLEKYSRQEASDIIEKFGGKTSSSVSKKTSYVLAGEEAGSKLDKAQELGITIISENEFEEMIK